jgi:hypothetical protein
MVSLAPRFDNEAGLDAFVEQSYPVLSGKRIEFLQMVATCANKKAERVFDRHAAMVFRATMGLQ